MFGHWCASEDDKEPWFQVDFKRMTTVTSVEIGMKETWTYVIDYVMRYSYDGEVWYDVKEGQSSIKVIRTFQSHIYYDKCLYVY